MDDTYQPNEQEQRQNAGGALDDPNKGATPPDGKYEGKDTAKDSDREAGPQYPLDPSRPPINPETKKVPVARGIPAPTILTVERDEEGVIPASAPVWEGGDPGVAAVPEYVAPDRPDVDQTYWPEAETPPVEESPPEAGQQPVQGTDPSAPVDQSGGYQDRTPNYDPTPRYDPTLPSNPNPTANPTTGP